jgi:hypothetical protein
MCLGSKGAAILLLDGGQQGSWSKKREVMEFIEGERRRSKGKLLEQD